MPQPSSENMPQRRLWHATENLNNHLGYIIFHILLRFVVDFFVHIYSIYIYI